MIVSVDTLVREAMFARLREAVASGEAPYDLVVFDEAHKLAAHQRPDLSVEKTDRYRAAEALAACRSTIRAGSSAGRRRTCCC